MCKRSVTIAGHRTSISLEPAFWDELQAIARRDGLSLNALVAQVDAERAAGHGRPDSLGGLSSALRLFVLDDLKARLEAAGLPAGDGEDDALGP